MQISETTHYPEFNILNLIDEWDSYTREIVKKRLGPFAAPSFFTEPEVLIIRNFIKNITFDNRDEIIDWVVSHLDNTAADETGENQRKQGNPPINILLREGLAAIDHVSRKEFGMGFHNLDNQMQAALISLLQLGKAGKIPAWSRISQKELFRKLVSEIISAYYSHPSVWSEIGYGGPAYPRGYVRIEFGLTDPWEARLDGK